MSLTLGEIRELMEYAERTTGAEHNQRLAAACVEFIRELLEPARAVLVDVATSDRAEHLDLRLKVVFLMERVGELTADRDHERARADELEALLGEYRSLSLCDPH